MDPAAILQVLVSAPTQKAQAELMKFDRQLDAVRGNAARGIEAKLGGSFNPAAFEAYEQRLSSAARRTADRAAFKAELGANFNNAAFNAYERAVEKAKAQTASLAGSQREAARATLSSAGRALLSGSGGFSERSAVRETRGAVRGFVGGGLSFLGGGLLGLLSGRGIKSAIDGTMQLAKETRYLTQVTGMDAKTATEWIAVAQSRGISASQLNVGLRTLSRASDSALTAAASSAAKSAAQVVKVNDRVRQTLALRTESALQGSKREIEAFQALGLSYGQVASRQNNMASLTDLVTSHLAKLHDGALKTSVANTLLGSSTVSSAKTANQAAQAFAELGITHQQLAKYQGNVSGLMGLIADRLDKMRGGTQKASIEAKLFGRNAASLQPIIEAGSKAMAEQRAQAEKYGITLGNDPVKNAKKLEEASYNLKLAQIGLSVQFTENLAPAMTSVIEHGTALAKTLGPGMRAAFHDLAPPLKDVAHWLGQHKSLLRDLVVGWAGLKIVRTVGGWMGGLYNDGQKVVKLLRAIKTLSTGEKAVKDAGGVMSALGVGKAGSAATALRSLPVAEMTVGEMIVRSMIGGGGLPGGSGARSAEKEAVKVAEEGAGAGATASLGARLLARVKDTSAGRVLGAIPGAAAAGLAGVSALSSMHSAQGGVLNQLNAAAHGVDPTSVLHLVGLPSVTDLLPTVKQRMPLTAQQIARLGEGQNLFPNGTQFPGGLPGRVAAGVPGQGSYASLGQQAKDALALNSTLAKLESHRATVNQTAGALTRLARGAFFTGDVKFTLADSLAAELIKTRNVASPGVQKIIGEFDKLAPGARLAAANAMLNMAQSLTASGELPARAADKVRREVEGKLQVPKGIKGLGFAGTNIPHQYRAHGGLVTAPGYFAGEEAPAHPEVVIATNPAYRQRNLALWADAGRRLGVRGFQTGGLAGTIENRAEQAAAVKRQLDLDAAALARAQSQLANLGAGWAVLGERKDLQAQIKRLEAEMKRLGGSTTSIGTTGLLGKLSKPVTIPIPSQSLGNQIAAQKLANQYQAAQNAGNTAGQQAVLDRQMKLEQRFLKADQAKLRRLVKALHSKGLTRSQRGMLAQTQLSLLQEIGNVQSSIGTTGSNLASIGAGAGATGFDLAPTGASVPLPTAYDVAHSIGAHALTLARSRQTHPALHGAPVGHPHIVVSPHIEVHPGSGVDRHQVERIAEKHVDRLVDEIDRHVTTHVHARTRAEGMRGT